MIYITPFIFQVTTAFCLFFFLKADEVHGIEDTCTYDYDVIQRVGRTDYIGEPIKILDQSASTVRFTVGNTWTTGDNQIVDQVFVVYPANALGERECYLDENVVSGQSIDTSLEAYCTQAGVAIVRIYIRDSSFGHAKDTAKIPDGCYDPDPNGANKPGLEYLTVLNCSPTCAEDKNENDYFDISYPTISPTSEITLFSCPETGEDPIILPSYIGGNLLEFEKSSPGSICTLIEANSTALSDTGETETGMKPVARTYNGYDWEASAGIYSSAVFDCSQTNSCTVFLPALQQGHSYALKSYSNPNVSDKNLKARFLEKTTFGPTKKEIEDFSSPVDWVTAQFEMEMTSHRAFFRQHLTHWHTETSYHSLLDTNACEKGARFRKYTFIHTDIDRMMQITTSPHNSSKVILSVDGQIRSIVDGPLQCGNWEGIKDNIPELTDGEYQICWHPLDGLEGAIRVKNNKINKCDCDLFFGGVYGNPMVNFDDEHFPDLPLIDLGENAIPVLSDRFYNSDVETEMLQLSTNLTDSVCNNVSIKTPGAPNTIRVGKTINNNGALDYWIHTTSFKLRNNDIDNPLPDGGKDAMMATADAPHERMMLACSSAPRTFLNEDSCILSENACYAEEGPDVDIELNLINLEKIHSATGGAGGEDTRYVYVVKGLRFDDVPLEHIDYPCTTGVRSRWIRVNSCADTIVMGEKTKAAFEQLLSNSLDNNNELVRDVFFPSSGSECNSDAVSSYGFKILLGGQCWENIHPDNYQVFDFTYWTTDAHPGNFNINRIKEFADSDAPTWVLTFPDWHPMNRWHENMENFPNVGRLGDNTTLKNLPSELFREDIAQAFGSTPQTVAAGGSVMVCGSPFEVATTIGDEDAGPLYKGGFDMFTRYNHTTFGLEEQRTSIWIDIALKAKDQLRQRIAFGLSQIIVMSPYSIVNRDFSESFLVFYDIFVRHAFGNYFDILKEVSYSPLMAEMLTYNKGASTGYSWARQWGGPVLQSPDENYAREIMQLFSIGLYKMNNDGTLELDSEGNPISTYTNKDITEYAKVYTGFSRRKLRSNVEDPRNPTGWSNNQIDPLQIDAGKKDHLPKLGLDRQYIGDGSPLCSDLPFQHFLKTGATYRLLGSNSAPDLLNDPDVWHGGVPKRLSLNFATSTLSSKMCDGNLNECKHKATFILDEDIPCDGQECVVDEPRTLEVAPGMWYEYVRPSCVNHAFFQNPKTIFRRWHNDRFMCGNPENHDASTVCCDTTMPWYEKAWRNEQFSGERVDYATVENGRCTSDKELRVCFDTWITNDDCSSKLQGGCDSINLWYWTKHDCTLSVKVNTVGSIAIIHGHGVSKNPNNFTDYRMVRNDTKMFFRADWGSDDDLDAFLSEYQTGCTESGGFIDPNDGLCQFTVEVNTIKLFQSDSELISIKNVLSKASIGAFVPVIDGEDVSGVVGIRKYPKGELSADTLFEFRDENGQKHFRKNVISEVSIGNGGLKIRNPVSFFSLSDFTIRDARYELDAALNHFFYHQNMAPFLAIRLSQRLGISNPSPRYIAKAASAFRTGLYEDFGSGKYGCLKATIAALLLDREVQDTTLDADPTQGSIREPWLKLVHLMRSLEFETSKASPFLRFGRNILDTIGQDAHTLPNVFSFFRSEYKPAGRIASAGLVAPESQVLNGPTSVNMMNMMLSFVKYGATDCFGGFGRHNENKYRWDHTLCRIGSSTNFGLTSYNSSNYNLNTADEIVDDLATLLTSGRLSDANRQLMIEAYNYTLSQKDDPYEAMVNVQQLMIASPEFQTTNTPSLNGEDRLLPIKPQPSGKPYKAVIYVMLSGGADSYNMLVPNVCSGTNADGVPVSEQYLTHRGVMAFDRTAGEFDLTISPSSEQPCSSFAVHDELKFVKELYDDNDLLWIANAGVVNQNGMTKNNFNAKTKTQLYAHNTMQEEAKKVDPYNDFTGTGVLGRANDVLVEKGHNVNALNIDEASVVLDGLPGKATPPIVVSSNVINTFGDRPDGNDWKSPEDETYFDIEHYVSQLNAKTSAFSGIFGELWSEVFFKGIKDAKDLKKDLEETANMNENLWDENASSGWDETTLLLRFKRIASLAQTHESRNTDRDIFYVEYGNFDHHDNMKANLRPKLRVLNANLKKLVSQLKEDGLWDNTVIYVTSEFSRTILPNHNEGSDHAWAQHMMLMGGQVKGGDILGQYPNDITPSSPLDDGTERGRFLPTTSNDAIWNSVLQWYGVTDETDLDLCLPNRHNTVKPVEGEAGSSLFNLEDMFK